MPAINIASMCAQEQIRTATPIQAPPPQDGASTNFATWARVPQIYTFLTN